MYQWGGGGNFKNLHSPGTYQQLIQNQSDNITIIDHHIFSVGGEDCKTFFRDQV